MKVNLTIKPSNVSGYLNINAAEGGDIASFGNMVSDSEAVEILATDIINFISMEKLELNKFYFNFLISSKTSFA